MVEIADADSFFTALWQRVQTLEQTHRQNPLGVDLLVNSTKRYLAKPGYRIQLDELFSQETERLIEQIGSSAFTPQAQWNQNEYRSRIGLYEASTEALARMAGVLGRWGDGSESLLVADILRAIRAHADNVGSGLTVWLNIRSYPAVLIFTAYGLGLLRSQRWNALHRLLSASLSREHRDSERIVESLFLGSWEGGDKDYWKQLEGLEKQKTPLSDHLVTILEEWSKSFVGVTANFEYLFEQFEILASLVHIESSDIAELDGMLARQDSQSWVWMPVGRSGWHSGMRERILSEILSDSLKVALLEAGFGNGSADFLEKSIENYRRIAGRMKW